MRAETTTAESATAETATAETAGAGPAGRPAPLPRDFFRRPAVQVAPDLLGCLLWHDAPQGRVAAVLTEVEAYEGREDPASHAYRGQTRRNAVMFGPPGHAYVYFSYGMHFCVNLVCQPDGHPSAVLLRAGRVVEGTQAAAARRAAGRTAKIAERDLARGPGRLCQALGIDRTLDGADICGGSPLGVGRPAGWVPAATGGIGTGPRVGISRAQDRPWRFWLAGDSHVTLHKPGKPRGSRAIPVASTTGRDGTMRP